MMQARQGLFDSYSSLYQKLQLSCQNYSIVSGNTYLTQDLLNSLKSMCSQLKQQIASVQGHQPKQQMSGYYDQTGLFNVQLFRASFNSYVNSIIALQNQVNAFNEQVGFGLFLNQDLSIIDPQLSSFVRVNPVTSGNLSSLQEFSVQWAKQNTDASMGTLSSGLLKISGCLGNIRDYSSQLSGQFDFEAVGDQHGVDFQIPAIVGDDSHVVKCNSSSVKISNTGSVSGMLSLNTSAAKHISRLMILPQENWNGLDQMFSTVPGQQVSTSSMFSSLKDITICLWTKYQGTDSQNGHPFIAVKLSGDQVARFSLGDEFTHSINGTAAYTHDLNSDQVLSSLTRDPATGQANWIMWTIHLDNTTGLGGINDTSYKGKSAAMVNAYAWVQDNDGEWVMKRFGLSQGVELSGSAWSVDQGLFKTNYMNSCLLNHLKGNYQLLFGKLYDPDKFDPSVLDGSSIQVGFRNYMQNGQVNSEQYNGFIRNLAFFAGHLTQDQINGLFVCGLPQQYPFHSKSQNQNIREMLKTDHFYVRMCQRPGLHKYKYSKLCCEIQRKNIYQLKKRGSEACLNFIRNLMKSRR